MQILRPTSPPGSLPPGHTLALSTFAPSTSHYHRSDPAACATPRPPGEAFHPLLLLMGLETGTLLDLTTPVSWSSNKNIRPHEALRTAHASFFLELAERIDIDRAEAFLNEWEFGNARIDGAFTPPFWHSGALLNSAEGLARFYARLYESDLPVNPAHPGAILEWMLWESPGTSTIRGISGIVQDPHQPANLGWHAGAGTFGGIRQGFAACVSGPDPASANCRGAVIHLLAKPPDAAP